MAALARGYLRNYLRLWATVGCRPTAACCRPQAGSGREQIKRQLMTYGEQQPMSITRAAARAPTGYGRRADPTSGTANSSWTNSPCRAGAVEHVAAGQEWHGSVPTYLHRIASGTSRARAPPEPVVCDIFTVACPTGGASAGQLGPTFEQIVMMYHVTVKRLLLFSWKYTFSPIHFTLVLAVQGP